VRTTANSDVVDLLPRIGTSSAPDAGTGKRLQVFFMSLTLENKRNMRILIYSNFLQPICNGSFITVIPVQKALKIRT
jgi:hypothetical protein